MDNLDAICVTENKQKGNDTTDLPEQPGHILGPRTCKEAMLSKCMCVIVLSIC